VNPNYNKELSTAKKNKAEIKKLANKLVKQKHIDLDKIFSVEHEEAFSKIDCLQCANCCKTTSPIFRMIDIERLSKHLGIKSAKFVEEYLKIDEDDDYVLKKSPCAFLQNDNTCSVYEHRPQACREYPHTNRKRIHQIMQLNIENTSVCPAVATIFNKLLTK